MEALGRDSFRADTVSLPQLRSLSSQRLEKFCSVFHSGSPWPRLMTPLGLFPREGPLINSNSHSHRELLTLGPMHHCFSIFLRESNMQAGESHSSSFGHKLPMMVNFTCQLDWVTRCQDYLVKHCFWCVCEAVHGRDLHLVWLRKADNPPQCGWASSNLWGPEEKSQRKVGFAVFLSWEHWSSSAWATHGPQAFRLRWTPHHWLWLSGLPAILLAFLGLQLADGRSWDFSASIIM